MVHLVLTHGRAQEFGVPASILAAWEPSLRWGLQRAKAPFAATVPISFAFYGDFWRPDAGETERSGPQEPSPLQAELAMDLLAAAPAKARAEETERLGWDSLNELVVWLDQRTHVGELALQWLLQDIEQYFADEALREQAMARIADTIEAAADEVILLGHSLGTIVAYDLLRRRPDLPLRGYVSFGSPLGLPSVMRELTRTGGEVRFPDGLPRWSNIYDARDFVTGNQALAPLYPAADGRTVADEHSVGRRPSPLKLVAAHDAEVYLSSIPLGKAVRAMVEAGAREMERGEMVGMAEASPPKTFRNGPPLAMVEAERGEMAMANGGERSGEPPAATSPPAFALDGDGDGAAAAGASAARASRKPSARTRRVERTASAHFPTGVQPGSVTPLRYHIGPEQIFAAASKIVATVAADADRLELTVTVQAPDFTVLDPATGKPSDSALVSLDPRDDRSAADGEFLLQAKATAEPLASIVHLRFRHGNTPVGHVRIPTIITPDAAAATPAADPPRSAAIALSAAAAPAADVAIFVNRGGGNTFTIAATRFDAASRDRLRQELRNLGAFAVEGEPWQWAKAMLEQFRLAREQPATERKRRVENLGRELWRQLPREFQEFYWDELHNKELTIAICSEEPYIPWELVKPEHPGAGKDAPMLGTAFSMARWQEDRQLPDPLVVSEFRVVAPKYLAKPLPMADLEAADLVARFRAKRVAPGKRAQVLKLLRAKNLQVLHFSGHGTFGASPTDTRLQLTDEPLVPIDLHDAGFARAAHPPLIFLNACEVGEQGWTLTQIGGWAEAFVEAGSAGFIGPYWAVNDQVARKAALLFYEALRAGQTVGEAMRAVRRQFTRDDEFRYHPTWLAYTLHCQPNVTVTFRE